MFQMMSALGEPLTAHQHHDNSHDAAAAAPCPLCCTTERYRARERCTPTAIAQHSLTHIDRHRAAGDVATRSRPWRKLLYIKQDYPDNYVDHTFLEEMQKNGSVCVCALPSVSI